MNTEELQAGEIVGPFQVIDPRGFHDRLPTAVIIEPHANAGVQVILSSRDRQVILAQRTKED